MVFPLTQALADASARWNVTVHDASIASSPSLFIYLGQDGVILGAAQLRKASWLEMTQEFASVPLEAITGACSITFDNLAKAGGVHKPELIKPAACAAACYLARTKTLANSAPLALTNADHVHAIVVRYSNGTASMVRPALLATDSNSMVSAEVLQQQVGQIETIDRARHPNWFPGAGLD